MLTNEAIIYHYRRIAGFTPLNCFLNKFMSVEELSIDDFVQIPVLYQIKPNLSLNFTYPVLK